MASGVVNPNEITKEDLDRVKKFIGREKIWKHLKTMGSFLIPHRSDTQYIFNIGGGSKTDGKKLWVGLPEYMIKSSFEEILAALLALLGHEAQHINSSDFEAYKAYRLSMREYFQNKYPHLNSKTFVKKIDVITKYFGNGTEDGRIEKILVNKLKGYLKYIKFFRGKWWEAQPVQGKAELNDFLFAIVTYATMGLMPRDYEKFYKGSESEANIEKLKPLIAKGVNAVTARQCLQLCKDMIFLVEPYLVKHLENLSQPDEEAMNSADASDEYTTSEEKDYNTNSSVSVHFKPQKMDKKEEEKEEEKKGEDKPQSAGKDQGEQSQDQADEDKPQNQDGSSESDEEDAEQADDSNQDVDEDSAGSGNESDEEDGSEEDEASGNGSESDKEDSEEEESKSSGNGSQLEDGDQSEETESSEEGDDADLEDDDESDSSASHSDENSNSNESDESEDDSSKNDSGNKETDDDITSDSDQDSPSGEQPDKIPDEEAVTTALNDLFKEIAEDTKDKVSEDPSNSSKSKKEKAEEESKLTKDDLQMIEDHYKDDSLRKFEEIRGVPHRLGLPDQIKQDAKRFRKEIEAIFRNKEAYTLRGQKRGILDVGNLHRVGAKDFNVFVKKGVPVTSDYVAYLLWDGSGSMSMDNKLIHSGYAVSVAEEGLKGIIPFKVSQFYVKYNGWEAVSVAHHVVKDFNENSRDLNYTQSFLYRRGANGGNKDGYSIRVATKELLKRPERDRILFIFSDGLPSDYDGGYEEGMRDVKEAVKEARAKGIFVVSLLFGNEHFRDMNIEKYKFMYEKNIISCNPSEITSQLIRVLKKVIAR